MLDAAIQAAARNVLAGFDRERIAPGVAIAICTLVLDSLLQHAPPHHRTEVLAALVPADDTDA